MNLLHTEDTMKYIKKEVFNKAKLTKEYKSVCSQH